MVKEFCALQGDLSLGTFNVTLDCFCSQPITMLVNSMRRNHDIRATWNGARWHVVTSQCHPLQKCPFSWGICTPSNTYFLGPTWVHIPDGILIGSAVFAGLSVVINGQTDRQTTLLPSVATGCIELVLHNNNLLVTYNVHSLKEISNWNTRGRWRRNKTSAFCILHSFDTVGWETRTSSLLKCLSVPLISKGFSSGTSGGR